MKVDGKMRNPRPPPIWGGLQAARAQIVCAVMPVDGHHQQIFRRNIRATASSLPSGQDPRGPGTGMDRTKMERSLWLQHFETNSGLFSWAESPLENYGS